MPEQPWPRLLRTHPTLLIAIVYHYIEGIALLWDKAAAEATSIHALVLTFPRGLCAAILFGSATAAWFGFRARRKITTLICLMPQQLLLYIAAGGGIEAVWNAQFADGVIRAQAFVMVEQALPILLALGYSWVIFLIMTFSTDEIRL